MKSFVKALIAAFVISLGACSSGLSTVPAQPTQQTASQSTSSQAATRETKNSVTTNNPCVSNPEGPGCGAGIGCDASQQCSGDPSGGSSGGGGGGGGGSIGGVPVAMTSPSPGTNCDGSPGALGTTDLGGSQGTVQGSNATTVVNIDGIKSNANQTVALGWVYFTGNGSIFVQYNTATGGSQLANFFANVAAGTPFAGPGIQAVINSVTNAQDNPVQLSPSQWSSLLQAINQKHAAGPLGPVLHQCFSSPLPLA